MGTNVKTRLIWTSIPMTQLNQSYVDYKPSCRYGSPSISNLFVLRVGINQKLLAFQDQG